VVQVGLVKKWEISGEGCVSEATKYEKKGMAFHHDASPTHLEGS